MSNRLTAGTIATLAAAAGVNEAPIDGFQYGRQDEDWTRVAWNTVINKPATFPPTLPIAESDVTNLVADLASKLPASAYTAADVLAKTKSVDGAGSGLDADLLDGQDSPYYLDWSHFTGVPLTFPPTLPIPQSGVTNLIQDLGLKAPLASPTFSGDPKTSTPNAGDNDTSIPTTAWTNTAIDTKVAAAVGGVSQFPEAPVDGLTYGRKNAAWATIVGGAVISDTPPLGPLQVGQLWWEVELRAIPTSGSTTALLRSGCR